MPSGTKASSRHGLPNDSYCQIRPLVGDVPSYYGANLVECGQTGFRKEMAIAGGPKKDGVLRMPMRTYRRCNPITSNSASAAFVR